MGQDFYRYVEGYNFPFCAIADTFLGRDESLTLNAPSGPGRLEQFAIFTDNPETSALYDDDILITVDGTVILDDSVFYFLLIDELIDFFGPIAAMKTSATYPKWQRVLNHDYRETYALKVTNTSSPDPQLYSMVAWGRYGI